MKVYIGNLVSHEIRFISGPSKTVLLLLTIGSLKSIEIRHHAFAISSTRAMGRIWSSHPGRWIEDQF